MAHIFSLLILFSLITTASASAAATTPSSGGDLRELETMMQTLRPLGYTLFCNAITTSDLQFQILSTTPSTLFAAKDPFLYALDMASDAAAYVSTLRYHVSPNRLLTHADLRNLKSPFLETLLPHYSILVSRTRVNGTLVGANNASLPSDVVRVDGVRISDPDMFLGSSIVVHGLDGILVTGIVKNDDLDDAERSLGFDFGSPAAEEGVSPGRENGTDGGKGKRGAKHEQGAGTEEARRGGKHQQTGEKGVKEARRGGKQKRVVHQSHQHQATGSNRRRQNRRARVHRKDDL